MDSRTRSACAIAGGESFQYISLCSLTEKHAESLLDICHDANSSPMDVMTVTETQNIILQSISDSEVRGSF